MVRWKGRKSRVRTGPLGEVISQQDAMILRAGGTLPGRAPIVVEDAPAPAPVVAGRSLGELQMGMDAIVYVHNHRYDLATMEPTNETSRRRFEYLLPHVGPLIQGKSVLDLGCNKGFLSLWCAENGATRVVGQDTDRRYIELLREVGAAKMIRNVEFTDQSAFKFGRVKLVRDYPATVEYDVALVLGVGHYLTFEGGLDWLYRLYFLGCDILFEFAPAATDPVLRSTAKDYPPDKVALMNLNTIKAKVKGLYDLEKLARSPYEGRHLYLLRKRALPGLAFAETNAGPLIAKHVLTKVYKRGEDEVVVVKARHRQDAPGTGYNRRWVRAQQVLAKDFPGVVADVRGLVVGKDGVVDGTVEEYLDGSGSAVQGARNLFDVQMRLVELGMFELDFHISDVRGASVVDLDFIEVLTPASEEYGRGWTSRTWVRRNAGAVGAKNRHKVESFGSRIGSDADLLSVLQEFRNVKFFG